MFIGSMFIEAYGRTDAKKSPWNYCARNNDYA